MTLITIRQAGNADVHLSRASCFLIIFRTGDCLCRVNKHDVQCLVWGSQFFISIRCLFVSIYSSNNTDNEKTAWFILMKKILYLSECFFFFAHFPFCCVKNTMLLSLFKAEWLSVSKPHFMASHLRRQPLQKNKDAKLSTFQCSP